MEINESLIRKTLCEFLIKKAKQHGRHVISKCKCYYNWLGDFEECSVKVETTYEDVISELIEADEYYKGFHIIYGIYYPIGLSSVKMYARVYLGELEVKE